MTSKILKNILFAFAVFFFAHQHTREFEEHYLNQDLGIIGQEGLINQDLRITRQEGLITPRFKDFGTTGIDCSSFGWTLYP